MHLCVHACIYECYSNCTCTRRAAGATYRSTIIPEHGPRIVGATDRPEVWGAKVCLLWNNDSYLTSVHVCVSVRAVAARYIGKCIRILDGNLKVRV